jgi:hypothetical protein
MEKRHRVGTGRKRRLTAAQQTARRLWDDVVMFSARDNARETEGIMRAGGIDADAGQCAIRDSADSIVESMGSARECDNYGLARPITAKVVAALKEIVRTEFAHVKGKWQQGGKVHDV